MGLISPPKIVGIIVWIVELTIVHIINNILASFSCGDQLEINSGVLINFVSLTGNDYGRIRCWTRHFKHKGVNFGI